MTDETAPEFIVQRLFARWNNALQTGDPEKVADLYVGAW